MDSHNQSRLPGDVSATMAAYTRLVDRKLAGRIRGLYLTGSVALDDYRPGQSDIDFVAVTDAALQPSELEMLRRVHTELPRIQCGPKLDGIYLTWADLAAAPVGLAVPYCLRDRFEPKGDFAVNPVTWCTLHRHPLTLRGPAQPVVHHDAGMLREWCRERLQSYWGAYVRSARGFGLTCDLAVWGVLGVTRPHATIKTGEMVSKTAAGRYALDTFPSRWSPIIREALAGRTGGGKSSYRNMFSRRRDALGFMDYVISDGLR
jgi:hypothetical protein